MDLHLPAQPPWELRLARKSNEPAGHQPAPSAGLTISPWRPARQAASGASAFELWTLHSAGGPENTFSIWLALETLCTPQLRASAGICNCLLCEWSVWLLG